MTDPAGRGADIPQLGRYWRVGARARVTVVIWLLRHGDAEAGEDDDARRLTGKGERQAELAGRALAALGVPLDACLSSPKRRALDTARLASQYVGVNAEPSGALAGGDFDPDELAAGRDSTLLVGHEPDFSRAIERSTGARVDLKKGGIAAIADGTLLALLRPDQIEAIARGG
jgi:phosphohistidine phosphatase